MAPTPEQIAQLQKQMTQLQTLRARKGKLAERGNEVEGARDANVSSMEDTKERIAQGRQNVRDLRVEETWHEYLAAEAAEKGARSNLHTALEVGPGGSAPGRGVKAGG